MPQEHLEGTGMILVVVYVYSNPSKVRGVQFNAQCCCGPGFVWCAVHPPKTKTKKKKSWMVCGPNLEHSLQDQWPRYTYKLSFRSWDSMWTWWWQVDPLKILLQEFFNFWSLLASNDLWLPPKATDLLSSVGYMMPHRSVQISVLEILLLLCDPCWHRMSFEFHQQQYALYQCGTTTDIRHIHVSLLKVCVCKVVTIWPLLDPR